MVIAGPGTGKTQVLTLRIANILLKTQVEPENILALTFTESGVAAMRKRLASIIGSPAYRVRIATFHGFANDIIQQYPESFPRIIGAVSSNEMEHIDVMRAVIEKTRLKILKPFGDPYHFVKPARSAIKELKKEGVSPDDFLRITNDEKRIFEQIDDLTYDKGAHKGKMKGKYQDQLRDIERNGELAILYEGYEAELRSRKLYDYEDMLMELLHALSTDERLLLILQEQYHYFLVDEHQDTNSAQNKILELLASFHDNPNIFMVGDEKQAIFRFQGASLENFLFFQKKYPDAKLINLTQNYRSTQTIIDAVGADLKSQKKNPEKPITLSAYSSPDVERYAVASDIRDLISDGQPAHEIALLYRENREAFPLARMLGKLAVPYVIESDLNILEDATIRKFLLILRAIDAYGEPLPLIEALHVDALGIDPYEIYKILQSGRNPYEVIGGELLRKMRLWKKIADNGTLEELFESVMRESGLLAQIAGGDVEVSELEKIKLLYEQIKSLTVHDFLRHIDTLVEHEVAIKYAPHYHSGERVRLMTAHRAKGLEFEQVFIINAVDKTWGNRRMFSSFRLPVPSSPDDDKNLFFVALTRAKREAHISYATTRSDGREQIVSQFVTEIKSELIKNMDMNVFEKAYQRDLLTLFAPVITHGGPDIRDREYLKNLFLTRGFSATHLNNYLACPWRYFYINLLRVPQPQEPHQKYGSAIHKALEILFNSKPRDLATLLDAFEKNIDLPDYVDRGVSALTGYWNTYHKTWGKEVITEFSIKGIELTPEIRLTGKLDKIEILSGGTAQLVNVVDYKTGKPHSRNALEKGNEKRQLVFYNLLLNKYADGKYKMQSGIIDFVEPTESGKYKREEFKITNDEVQNLEKEIHRVAKEILNLEFWDRVCDDKDCQWCALRKLMK